MRDSWIFALMLTPLALLSGAVVREFRRRRGLSPRIQLSATQGVIVISSAVIALLLPLALFGAYVLATAMFQP